MQAAVDGARPKQPYDRQMDTWNVLLVDDHALFREGLSRLLSEISPGASVHHAGSYDQALAQLQRAWSVAPIDLVLLDLGMPGQAGLSSLLSLREAWPAVPVVVLSGTDDSPTVLGAIDAGAVGFVSKACGPDTLAQALQCVLAGGVYLPPAAAIALPSLQRTLAAGEAAQQLPALTPRQWDVLRLLLQGQPNKRIELALGLAPPTVKSHVSAVLRALGVTTRTQAVIAASRLHLHWRVSASPGPSPGVQR
jgi:DNA-binding NarL/FixJ family response regulator